MGNWLKLILVGILASSLALVAENDRLAEGNCTVAFDSLWARTNYSTSEPVPDRGWEIINRCARETAEDSAALAWGFFQMIHIYDLRLEYNQVLACCDSAARIWDRLLPKHRKAAQSTYLGVSAIARRFGDYASSERLFAKACRETLIVPIADAYYSGSVLKSFGDYLKLQGNINVAERYYLRAADYYLDPASKDDSRHQKILELGNLEQELGNYERAEYFHRVALAMREALFGSRSRQVASSLNNIGNVFLARSQYDSAWTYYHDAYMICLELPDSSHATKITLLCNLADIAARRGQFEEAARNYELVIASERSNPNRSLAAYYINAAANVQLQMGNLDRATELLEEALALRRQVHDLNEAVVPANLADLARVYVERANYQVSEELYLEAVASHSRVYNSDHPGLIEYFISLGKLYTELNRIQEAQDAYIEANRIARIHFGDIHDQLAQIHLSLAKLYLQQDLLTKSTSSLAAARKIWQTLFGEQHPSLADALALEVAIKLRSNDPGSALKSAQRCLDMREALLDSMHPAIAESWNLLAEVQLARGDYVPAIAACANAESIYQNVFGHDHPTIAGLHELRAKIYSTEGKRDSAFHFASRAVDLRLRHLRQNAVAFSERDGLLYSDKLRDSRNLMLGCFFSSPRPISSDSVLCAQLIVKTKALVTQDIAIQRRNYHSKDARYDTLAAQIQHTRSIQMREFVKGPQGEPASVFKRRMDSLRTVVEVKEKELARITAAEREFSEQPVDPLRGVQKILSDTTQLVEYIKYTNLHNSSRYAAIAIAKTGTPRIIDLGPVESIDSLVSDYSDHFETIARRGYAVAADIARYQALAKEIYNRIIRICLAGNSPPSDLTIAADGNLNLISFAALISGSGRYLIESTRISYLSTARELLHRNRTSSSGTKSLLAIGDPDFNTLGEFAATSAENVTDESSAKIAYRSRSLRSSCLSLSATQLSPLPSSGLELKAIDEQWRHSARGASELLLGASASEERFKASCRGKSAIHIATHGYAFGPDCAGAATSANGHADPMLNSGVFLAGANQALTRIKSGQEDGILMASEVLSLDLRATDLVVLSSCMSGRGEVFDGEGVFGLRRAFLLAGAKSVVSSLWSVPDIETAELMQAVYQSADGSFATALCSAQRKRLNDLRSEGRFDHPFSWGGFLLTKSGQ